MDLFAESVSRQKLLEMSAIYTSAASLHVSSESRTHPAVGHTELNYIWPSPAYEGEDTSQSTMPMTSFRSVPGVSPS